MTTKKIDITALNEKKQEGVPITMITAYDTPTARIVDEAGVDIVLVGDSAANVVLGYKNTTHISVEELLHHTRAVSRGLERAFLLGDMPFMSYNVSVGQAIENGGRFMQQGRTEAVKIEGGDWVADTARAMIKAGIPVVGHLGLTPQTAGLLGGYRVQGKTAESACQIMDDARRLEDAGVFLLVLECVPTRLGKLISDRLQIPVIGIGAGPDCDGQVLVFHDMVGIQGGFSPKFVKRYAEAGKLMKDAVTQYCKEVTEKSFPDEEHSFKISDEEFQILEKALKD